LLREARDQQSDTTEDDLRNWLGSFCCDINPDVQHFLHDTAIRFEDADKSRTYLIIDDDFSILAYFTISITNISLVSSEISKTRIKKLDGFDKDAEEINAYLIGQIARNFAIKNNSMHLRQILDEAYAIINKIQDLVGVRAIILECASELVPLYKKHSFDILLNDDQHSNNSLVTMYINLQRQ
jgi:hypothetical protein